MRKGHDSTEKRFAAGIQINTETWCWEWTGKLIWNGYGVFRAHGIVRVVHRYTYERFIGPIPEGLVLDHLCRNRKCCNPWHVEPCTRGENVLRGETITAKNRDKTHCKRGHEFTPENTYIYKTKSEGGSERCCVACHRLRLFGENDEKRALRNAKKKAWREARKEHFQAKSRQYAATRKAKLAHASHATAPSG